MYKKQRMASEAYTPKVSYMTTGNTQKKYPGHHTHASYGGDGDGTFQTLLIN